VKGRTEVLDPSSGEVLDNEVSYIGGIHDEATGLYYLNARHYDPADGCFTSMDTYRGESDSPLSLNLYAYCQGDPVNLADPDGHSPNGPRLHYNHNKRYDPDSYVYNQLHKPVSQMVYGSLSKSFSDIGCGPAAVYNATLLLGKRKKLSKVVYDLERKKLDLLGGILGTNLWGLKRYFRSAGLKYKAAENWDAFYAMLKPKSVYIVAIWNQTGNKGAGAHYFAAQYSQNKERTEDNFTIYNRYWWSDSLDIKHAAWDMIGDGEFIYGYKIWK
jgi:RHS repeat-associated protein